MADIWYNGGVFNEGTSMEETKECGEDLSKELTDAEVERIDDIQNAAFEFVNSILPRGAQVDWDIEMLDGILETVWEHIEDRGICTEREFYPFVER
jgi:hypothetical protein